MILNLIRKEFCSVKRKLNRGLKQSRIVWLLMIVISLIANKSQLCLEVHNFTAIRAPCDLKSKLGQISPPSDEQPCDLRLFTPATCLIEFRAAAAQAIAAQAQNLSQAAATAIGNNNNSQPTATIGPVPSSQQLPFIKGLGLLPRTSLNTPQQSRDQIERKYDPRSSSSTGSASGTNQLSPLSQTPIPSAVGAPYSCSRCGNTYARPHSLNRHIRFECGVEPKHNLVLHMRTHQHR
ncbi:CLUMA_CG002587, isoform A [Clunio marinus]|uniref:CLUMA_CG002587, isoform A n=1 Tax=Clunio marinus TaxID=568069 RepID=A0A1J1HRJ1_9DIPT|nr:CLUMA_CG002587, isoform A [Clunio marinus]